MKKSFHGGVTLLAILLLMGFCQGCGKNESENVSTEDEATVESSKEEATATDKTSEEETGEVNEEEESKEVELPQTPPKLMIQNIYHYEYKVPESYEALMTGTYALVQLNDDSKVDYPELSKSLDDFNKRQEDDFLKVYESYLSDARSWYEELENKNNFSECYIKYDIDIVRADNAYLSVRVNEEDYMGGAHGAYGSGGYNYDSISGKELALKDIIPDIDTLRTLVKDKITEKYSDSVVLDSLDEAIMQYLTGEEDQGCSWFITPEGVDIYFGIYQLGAYASGTQTVSILYDENPELFTEEFRKQEDNYVEAINIGEIVTSDINGDGKAEQFVIEPVVNEYDWVDSLKFTVNGNENNLEVYGYETTPYLVRVGGNTYIYVEMVEENDYRMTCAFRVNGDKVEKIGEYGGYITDKLPLPDYESEWNYYWKSAFTSPNDLYIGDTIQIFSTHTGIAKAYINDAGELVKTDDYYYAIGYDGNDRIKSKKDLKADIIDKESLEIISEDVDVSAGTKFSIYGTKGEDTLDLMDSNGKLYRFTIKSDTWPQTIDGVDIEELFEGIMFAG